MALLDVSGWVALGWLGSQRSDPVLPSVSPLWSVWLVELLFGIETTPDGTCCLLEAENWKFGRF